MARQLGRYPTIIVGRHALFICHPHCPPSHSRFSDQAPNSPNYSYRSSPFPASVPSSDVFDNQSQLATPSTTHTANVSCMILGLTFTTSSTAFYKFPIFTTSITNKRRRLCPPPFPIRFRTYAETETARDSTRISSLQLGDPSFGLGIPVGSVDDFLQDL